jgi:hypothetical protein
MALTCGASGSTTGGRDARLPSGLAIGPGRWAGPRVDLVEHPLGLHDPGLSLVLAVEAIDRPKAALSRLQADAEGAVGLLDQLKVWDTHGGQYGTGAPGLHPQSVGISFRTVQSAAPELGASPTPGRDEREHSKNIARANGWRETVATIPNNPDRSPPGPLHQGDRIWQGCRARPRSMCEGLAEPPSRQALDH